MTSDALSLGSSSFLINLSVMFIQTKCTVSTRRDLQPSWGDSYMKSLGMLFVTFGQALAA